MQLNDAVIFNKIKMMKSSLFLIAVFCCLISTQAQESKEVVDSIKRGFAQQECPNDIAQYINTDIFKTKAVLLVFNESLLPLGLQPFYFV